MKNPAFTTINKSFNQRCQMRNILILSTKDLKSAYLGEGYYLQINDGYLVEATEKNSSNGKKNASEEPFIQLLEQLLKKINEQTAVKNISKIAKEFKIEKFIGRY
ncbi:hypothetical protein M0804_014254 [Polistes exclamans]|nr:hypothetical protein M0804_014254 [Polistes exclamans]